MVALGIVLTGCAGDYTAIRDADVTSELADRAREGTLRVRAILCNGAGYASGSGFAVGPRTLITNRHVAENTELLQLSTWDGRDVDVRVGTVSYVNDLAVLEIIGTLDVSFRVGDSSAAPGDTVYAVGYPQGGAWTLTEGTLYDIVDGEVYEETGEIIRSTAGIEPGNSGGPLLDTNGDLVGVVFAIDRRNGLSLAISADRLDDLEDKATSRVGSTTSC